MFNAITRDLDIQNYDQKRFSEISIFHVHPGRCRYNTLLVVVVVIVVFVSSFSSHSFHFVVCVICIVGALQKSEFFSGKCIFISILIALQFKYSVLSSQKTLRRITKQRPWHEMQNNRSSDMQCSNLCCDNTANAPRMIYHSSATIFDL